MHKSTLPYIVLILIFLAVATSSADQKQISVEDMKKFTKIQAAEFMANRDTYCLSGLKNPDIEKLVQKYRRIKTYHATWLMSMPQINKEAKQANKRMKIKTAFDRQSHSLFCLNVTEIKRDGKWVRLEAPHPESFTQLIIYADNKLNVYFQSPSFGDPKSKTKTTSYKDEKAKFAYRDFRRSSFLTLFDLAILASPIPINEILQANVDPTRLKINKLKNPNSKDEKKLDSEIIIYSKYETHARLVVNSATALIREYGHISENSSSDNKPPVFKLESIRINEPLNKTIFDFNHQKELLEKN